MFGNLDVSRSFALALEAAHNQQLYFHEKLRCFHEGDTSDSLLYELRFLIQMDDEAQFVAELLSNYKRNLGLLRRMCHDTSSEVVELREKILADIGKIGIHCFSHQNNIRPFHRFECLRCFDTRRSMIKAMADVAVAIGADPVVCLRAIAKHEMTKHSDAHVVKGQAKHAVRSVFISDIHLGKPNCQAELLLDFLQKHPAENLYLLGDIVDFWTMGHNIHWTSTQNAVIQKMLHLAQHGTMVTLIPGNHDEVLREYAGTSFGDIRIERDLVHVAIDGRRYLLIHGDELDHVTFMNRGLLSAIGDIAYISLVQASLVMSWLRRNLHQPGWSLAWYAKHHSKATVNFVSRFEDAVVHEARRRDVDGVICGHVHWPALRNQNGFRYINCGDWLDNCTAVVEHHNGQMELIQWSKAWQANYCQLLM